MPRRGCQQLDLGVRQLDEDRLHPVRRLVLDGRDRGAECVTDSRADAAAMSGTAMATWLRRPSFSFQTSGSSRLGRPRGWRATAALRRVIWTSTIGRLLRGRLSAWRTVVRTTCSTRSSSHDVAIVEVLDRIGDQVGRRRLQIAEAGEVDGRRPQVSWGVARTLPTAVEDERRRRRCRGSRAGAGTGSSSSPESSSSSVSSTRRPTGTSPIDLGRQPGARRTRSPFADDQRLLDAEPLGEARMVLVEVAGLAVHRDDDLGASSSGYICSISSRAGVARDMDEMVVLGDHLDAHLDQKIVQVVERSARCRG